MTVERTNIEESMVCGWDDGGEWYFDGLTVRWLEMASQ